MSRGNSRQHASALLQDAALTQPRPDKVVIVSDMRFHKITAQPPEAFLLNMFHKSNTRFSLP